MFWQVLFQGILPRNQSGHWIWSLFRNSSSPSSSSDRLIYLTREPQTPIICDTLSAPGSSGHRRNDFRLEQMGIDLSVSPSQCSDEGTREDANLQREGNPNYTTVAEQLLVSSSDGTQSIQVPTDEPSSISTGQRRDML